MVGAARRTACNKTLPTHSHYSTTTAIEPTAGCVLPSYECPMPATQGGWMVSKYSMLIVYNLIGVQRAVRHIAFTA